MTKCFTSGYKLQCLNSLNFKIFTILILIWDISCIRGYLKYNICDTYATQKVNALPHTFSQEQFFLYIRNNLLHLHHLSVTLRIRAGSSFSQLHVIHT